MRFIGNVVLKTAMILVMNWLGWLTLRNDGPPAKGPKELITVALVAALLFAGVTLVTMLLTCGLAILSWVFLGWIILEIMAHVAPTYIGLSHYWWLTALSGFLILMAILPVRRRQTSSPSAQISN